MHLAAENYCVNIQSTQHTKQSALQLNMVLKAYSHFTVLKPWGAQSSNRNTYC